MLTPTLIPRQCSDEKVMDVRVFSPWGITKDPDYIVTLNGHHIVGQTTYKLLSTLIAVI